MKAWTMMDAPCPRERLLALVDQCPRNPNVLQDWAAELAKTAEAAGAPWWVRRAAIRADRPELARDATWAVRHWLRVSAIARREAAEAAAIVDGLTADLQAERARADHAEFLVSTQREWHRWRRRVAATTAAMRAAGPPSSASNCVARVALRGLAVNGGAA